jgi:zinc finger FYVE domain-containing protein 26
VLSLHYVHVVYFHLLFHSLQYARPQLLPFMFKHGHYDEACSLFLESNFPSLLVEGGGAGSTSSIQRADSLANDYGSVDDLCELCIGYGAMSELASTLKSNMQSPTVQQDQKMKDHVFNLLIRICNYCETHRHFNYLYQFLVCFFLFCFSVLSVRARTQLSICSVCQLVDLSVCL